MKQLIAEESPVGEKQSNVEIEKSLQLAQGRVSTLGLALQRRYRRKLRVDHPSNSWPIHHFAFLVDI